MAHDETRKFNRRDLLSVGGAAAAGAALAGCAHAVAPQATTPAQSAPVPAASPPAVTEGKGVQRFRTLGRTGFKVSDIGMGCSRMSEANVVRYAYDKGVNFFDCAETYSNGESERQIGEAMAHMDRAKIFLTTKLRLNPDDSEAAIRERVGKCLERMKTSYVDGLYLHSPPTVAAVKHEAFHKAGAQLKAEGKVRHLGLSSHGPRGKGGDSMEQVLLSAVADGRFDVMLLVYNFLNHKEGDVVLKACREKNIGTACMKASPGVLMVSAFDPDNPSEEHAALLKQFMAGAGSREKAIDKVRRSLKADEKKMAKDRPLLEPIANRYGLKTQEDVNRAGIQWVLGNDDMHTVCVSLADFDLVDKTVPLSGTSLTIEGLALLRAFENGPGSDYCRHGCTDCVDACPHGLPISTIMRYAYYFHLQGREKYAMGKYAALGATNASRCLDCDAPCTDACPFGVRAQANLWKAHSLLAST